VIEQLVTADQVGEAKRARLLVAIAFHYSDKRCDYLTTVLDTLMQFPVERLEVVVFTNTCDPTELLHLKLVCESICIGNNEVRVEVAKELRHPFELTWAHKGLITGLFLVDPDKYTHFIYLEDDEGLSFDAFCYFVGARSVLRRFRLIPGLLRVEWNAAKEQYMAADNLRSVDVGSRPFVSNGIYAFIEPHNPYFGAFILDAELAHEYVSSRSFHVDESRKVTNWHIRERAAMGLTFENPPHPFVYRYVVPVLIASATVPKCAWLPHLPNRFVNNPNTRFGKLAISELFVGSFGSVNLPSQDYELFLGRGFYPYIRLSIANGKRRAKMLLKYLFPYSRRLG